MYIYSWCILGSFRLTFCFPNNSALAPSSTFTLVTVASPAKLQAATALTEVANGIEGGVSSTLCLEFKRTAGFSAEIVLVKVVG